MVRRPDMQLVRPPKKWWENTEELAEFADWMDGSGRDHWKSVVAKPWHYDAAHREYERELDMERYDEEERARERESRYWGGGDAA